MGRKLTLFVFVPVAALVAAFLLFMQLTGPRDKLEFDDPHHQPRSLVTANDYAVVSGTPWSTQAAIDVLEQGGNAVDAAVAAVLMLNVTFGEAASFPGVAPVMFYDATRKQVRSYIGAGTAPGKATIELFGRQGHDKVPDLDILAQLLPASPDVIVRLLQDHGTLSFSSLVRPAIEKARSGFPVHFTMAKNLNLSLVERLGFRLLLPTSSEVYFGERWWLPLRQKDHFRRPDLADSLEALATAEQNALRAGASRREALEAVRTYFYEGPIARKIADFHESEDGLISYQDLAGYQGGWEEPLVGSFGQYTIYVNGTWSQGVVVPMVLQILDTMNLHSMQHNSAEYIHLLIQAIDLAMADREAYIADTAFVDVPLPALLSREYANQRRRAMTQMAFPRMPDAGRVGGPALTYAATRPTNRSRDMLLQQPNPMAGDDTSQVVVVDREGNAIAITPSDFPMSPMIPGTGLTLGIRMTQFSLDPAHPNRLQPGKRPRITPHAAIVFRDGEFYMAFNTPGGDMQTQALVQVFLNLVVFGMDIQEAIKAPRVRSYNFPNSFDPEDYSAGRVVMESALYDKVSDELQARRYTLERSGQWDNAFGAVGAIVRSGDQLFAASDPRESGVAAGR